MRARIAKFAAGVAIVAGLGLGFTQQAANAGESSGTVWLWKDATGKCPAVCDGSLYACPCRVAENEY